MLEKRVDLLNSFAGQPPTTWTRDADGMSSNIGNYHVSYAYGGVSLHQIMNKDGGVHDVFRCGHVPKRELFDRICSLMDGIQTRQWALKRIGRQ
jgi:hypothetical protein